MRAFWILALGLLAAPFLTAEQRGPARDTPPPSASGFGAVRGRVVADEGGLPLTRARISVNGADGRLRIDPVFSDASGRFEFTGLPAARYTLAVTKTGYVWGRLGADDVERTIQFDLADRGVIDGLDVRLRRAAAIAGRILDDSGEPVLAAEVSVGRPERVNGRLRLAAVRGAVTDDRGEFRVGGLFAGTYVVSVAGARAGTSLPGAPEEWRRNITWSQTYFPGTPELGLADRLALKTGEEFLGADIILRPASGNGGRLTVNVNDPSGNPVPAGALRLNSQSMGLVVGLQKGRGTSPPLPPGDWTVTVAGTEGTATTRVAIDSSDVALDLVLAKGARISGRIVVEGSDSVDLTRLPLAVTSTDSVAFELRPFTNSLPVTVNRDGTFEVRNVIGSVDFSLRGNGAWFVQSVTHENRSLLDSPIEFMGGEELTNVRVTIAAQTRALSGAVVNTQRMPVVGCYTIVFPEDPLVLRSGRLTRRVRSDLNGRFQLTNLPPGAYFAVAMAKPDAIEWSTPEYLSGLRPAATHLALSAGETTDVTLECRDQP